MKTRARFLLLSVAASLMLLAPVSAQTTVDQRLTVAHNDGFTGGIYTIALEVKATNLTGRNTLGTATIDIQYDGTKFAYLGSTFPDAPSGISFANGYFVKSVTQTGNTVRFGILPLGVNGVSATGTDLTTAYVTWGTASFTILNTGGSVSFTINSATNQIGLFAQEGNSSGPGIGGNGIILDQPLSTPIVINETSLPVELASFTVNAERLGTRLTWKTATETNNAGFEIERADLSGPSLERTWTRLGFVEGAGTCAAERSYSFTVRDAPSGRFVYRLKQIDRDGGATYSQEVEAPVVMPRAFALLQNYPNPFNPSTSIGFALPEDCHVSIVAYDIIGRQAAVILNDTRSAGFHTIAFDAGSLSSGIYVYRMTARSGRTVFTDVKRFVLMH